MLLEGYDAWKTTPPEDMEPEPDEDEGEWDDPD